MTKDHGDPTMSTLVIKDLAASKDLDKAAAMKICGGLFSTSWIVARPETQRLSSTRTPSSLYNIVTNNYNLVNPTFFNVYNGDDNSGTIANNFNTLSLTTASPTLIG
jgi:hypothetical protein